MQPDMVKTRPGAWGAAGGGAEHGYLGAEVAAIDRIRDIGLCLAQAAGVKAVTEGVGVAGLGVEFARGGHSEKREASRN